MSEENQTEESVLYSAWVDLPTGEFELRLWADDIRAYEVDEVLSRDQYLMENGKHDDRIQRGGKPLPLSYGLALRLAQEKGRGDVMLFLMHDVIQALAFQCRTAGRTYAETVFSTGAMRGPKGITPWAWEEFGGCDELAEASAGEYWWALNKREKEQLTQAVINGACSAWAKFMASGGTKSRAMPSP